MDSKYEKMINELEAHWVEGITKLFEEQGKEHKQKLIDKIGGKDPAKIYLSPSKASIIMNIGGVPQLQGMCHRAIFFASLGFAETNPMDPYTKRKLLAGSLMEQSEHDIEKLSGKYVASNELFQYAIDDHTMILGEVDSILEDDHQRQYVKELKTAFGYMATRNHIYGTKTITPYPRWSAVLQIVIYIATLGLQYGVLKFIDGQNMKSQRMYIIELKNIEQGGQIVDKIVVINGQEMSSISMSAIMERLMRLATYIRERQLPPRECIREYSDEFAQRLYEAGSIAKSGYERHLKGEKSGDWQCRNCNHQDLCWMKDEIVQRKLEERIEIINKEHEESDVIETSGEVEALW